MLETSYTNSRIISDILPEIHTMEKCYFLKPLIHSQMISFSFAVSKSALDSKGTKTQQVHDGVLTYHTINEDHCTQLFIISPPSSRYD